MARLPRDTGGRGMLFWIVAIGVTGVTLPFVINLQRHARAVYACSRADRVRGVRGLVAVGIIAEAIHRRVLDQLSMC
jgi:hypothetical protein